jgi:hypothetical protein
MPDVPQTCKAAPPSKNKKCNPATKRMQTTKASCITAVGVQHFSKVTVVADYLQILANATTDFVLLAICTLCPNNRLARLLTAATVVFGANAWRIDRANAEVNLDACSSLIKD